MRPEYVPTPEQIRKACLDIQEGWSKTTERHRRGLRGRPEDRHYEFPLVSVRWLTGERED